MVTIKVIEGEIETVRTQIKQMKIRIEVLKMEIDKASQIHILLKHHDDANQCLILVKMLDEAKHKIYNLNNMKKEMEEAMYEIANRM